MKFIGISVFPYNIWVPIVGLQHFLYWNKIFSAKIRLSKLQSFCISPKWHVAFCIMYIFDGSWVGRLLKMGFRSVWKNCYRLFVGLLQHIFNFHWLIMKPQNPWWVLYFLVKGVKYSFGRFHILLCFVTKVCIIIATWRKKAEI